jgi:hypothetical protein
MNKYKCKVKGCKRNMKVKKHGLCGAHLARLIKNGDIKPHVKIRKYDKMEPFLI